MKTKLLSLFVALMCASSIFASNTQVDGIWYDFDSSTKTASVTYRGSSYSSYENEYSGSVVIPEKVTYNSTTYSVTTIGEGAFRDCKDLTSVIIPNSVTTIGDDAFCWCTGLTSITISNSVTTIGGYAFYYCRSLTSVAIPNSVTTIGDLAFCGCSGLTSINVDAANTHYCSIDGILFNYAKDALIQYPIANTRTEYTIPNSVTTIGDAAFYGCKGLTSITIPNSVTTIGDLAFYNCSGLTSINVNAANMHYASIDGVLFNYAKDILVQYPAATTRTEYTIPNSVKTIGEDAFCWCIGLTSVTIPNSVTTIGNSAFYGCSGLTSVTIPNSVTTIGEGAFYGCEGLTSVTIPNSVTEIESAAFFGCSGLTSVIIPYSVTTIGDLAFSGCTGLTSITIPNSVTTIGGYAFKYCTGLTSVTIGNSVTTIGDWAFEGCSNIKSVTWNAKNCNGSFFYYYDYDTYPFFGNQVEMFTFGDKVEVIPSYICKGMNKLTSITIPNSVTEIGDYAFYNCERISTVTLGSGLLEIGDYAFSGDYRIADITCYAEVTPTIYTYTFKGITKKNVYLYVPENVIRRYQIDPYWNEFDIRTKSADVKPITGDQATVLPSANDAILTWPISNGTYTYTITITKGGETICLLTFNAQGQLQNIAFAAPGHDGAHQAPAATLIEQGYQFTVTGLNPGTAYSYNVTATDASRQTLAEYKGNFSTTGGTGLNTLPYKGKDGIGSKYFHNGNLIIERNGIKYTATGQKVR